ncbi:SDR family oxidoreductase [Phenylobacterium sp.]|uniref:SDR family oxidoreductase n=1 Tax=Phenylobacterium sp. TaxID=1871053 RepID=UPI00286D0639|nr:SDR family oxidoreductase [Phenylobacterium sp.]
MSTILITGASRGIGLELARQYAEAGERVFATCRAPAEADDLKSLASGADGRLTVHALDVGDGASIASCAKAVGDTPIDVLINNAGILGGKSQTLESIDFDAWVEAFKVMTIGPFRMVQSFLPNLKAAAAPKVMTVTSQLAASTWPFGGSYAYSSAKAGVNKVMQTLAKDLKAQNITVAMIHPGWVKTDMGGAGADITAQESATGIRSVIAGLTSETSGRFYKWNGEIHPW